VWTEAGPGCGLDRCASQQAAAGGDEGQRNRGAGAAKADERGSHGSPYIFLALFIAMLSESMLDAQGKCSR
jgi:hypothetical protein